jgi:pimeloyl-ACP methyl ester carboxylesterase
MELNHKVFGSGEPLIILHGLLGSLDNWQSVAKEYAEHFTVFIIDQRNHGKSPHADAFSYDLLVQDLLAFCEQQHIYKTHLLGHSMGGKVAMQFALENQDFIDKLLIADIAPVAYAPEHNEIFKALRGIDAKTMKSRKEVELALAQTIKNFGVRQFLMKGLTRGENNVFEWKFNLESIWKNYDNILDIFHSDEIFLGETLFINGSNSSYVLPEHQILINQYFPKNKRETISNAGHWLHAEQPEEFCSKTLKFLLNN